MTEETFYKTAKGLVVFVTGLSGSGKSTISKLLKRKIESMTSKPVTLLDGDNVRKHLSQELGYSKEHRDININRISFLASEIAKHGGIVICAAIAPYDEGRKKARMTVASNNANFVLVWTNTPIEICEERDVKGLYKSARQGLVKNFTGISDPYEAPSDADYILEYNEDVSADESSDALLSYLAQKDYIRIKEASYE